MSSRNWQFRLQDIQEALERIEQYIAGVDLTQWHLDTKTVDAVIRNLEIIGEATAHLPDDIVLQNKDIPWEKMRGMRNLLAHEYFGVDIDIIWQTAIRDLPELKIQIKKMLNDM